MERKIRYTAVFAVVMALCLMLSSCELPFGLGGRTNNGANSNAQNAESNTNNNENTVPPVPEEPTVTQKVSDIIKWANDSLGIWELMGYMFPDHAVYRVSGEGYILEPVNKDLPLNRYDLTRSAEALKGIDVSTYQKDIDWDAVAASGEVNFAIIRLGYRGYGTGRIVKDNKVDYNAKEAVAKGIPIGLYFVTKAINPDEAKEEAEWILDQIKTSGYKVTWPIVMDFEPPSTIEDRTWFLSPQETSDIIIAFCETIKKAGYTPMIYGNIGTFMTTMDQTTIGDYPKWFAQYFNSPHFPYAFQIWQATSDGQIPGIDARVDIDYAMFNYSTGSDVLQPYADEDPQAGKGGQQH